MCCKGFIKRVFPFFLTFAVGLFIASFFVTIAAPSFNFKNRAWKKNHRKYDRQREAEIQRLQEENRRLKTAVQQLKVDEFEGTYQMNEDGSAKLLKYKATINGERVDDLVPPPSMSKTVPFRDR
jgi:uncharacterized protein YlxW (UPF0749 family)